MLHELVEILVDNRKWRVGHHDVGFIEQLHALLAPEVAVPFELGHPDLLVVNSPVSVLVAVVNELDTVPILLIASRDKLLQTKELEVNREVLKEIGLSGIVAVAVDNFTIKMIAVVLKLVLDVGKLSVKFIILSFLCFV